MFRGSTINVVQMLEHLKMTAKSLGLPFGERTHTYNSRLAQELGLWAEKQGKGNLYHLAVFRAYFVDGSNLAASEILQQIILLLDLSVDEARNVLIERTFSHLVDADWQKARMIGVTAVPTFVTNGETLVGAHSYGDLASFVAKCGAQLRVS